MAHAEQAGGGAPTAVRPLSTARVDQLIKQGSFLTEILEDSGWNGDEVSAMLMRLHNGMLMAAPWAIPVSLLPPLNASNTVIFSM